MSELRKGEGNECNLGEKAFTNGEGGGTRSIRERGFTGDGGTGELEVKLVFEEHPDCQGREGGL